ncbi:ubiquitin carboxyl-terminal hydrolase 16-like [Dorcoceras hygrometricum]|uniref:ubiquitinyl hydrolase 1 n=1 Tax=Dorcoceras hygrometricum TaxID=472368 RepID=A0A2Z7C9W7_9LAMI|nr:ubiquitin carboxyl-terminal hydrolase 16-like [Dorcoceras hygrometricum]
MLLGADLGWWLSSVVVVVVVVGWFVARRRWRRAVARRQEITRLLALASEETARAELEAVATYSGYEEEPMAVAPGSSPQRQFQYQCEVCFSPTTTRCKRCKAVHYCSGKCQIIHWRQGHRDECNSLSSQRSNDVMLVKQDEFQSNYNLNGVAARHPPSSGDDIFSDPSLHVRNEKNYDTIAYNKDGRETSKIAKASVISLPDGQTTSTIMSDMPIASTSNLNESNQFEAVKSFLPKQSSSANLVQDAATPGVLRQFKSGSIVTDEQAESSISSGSDASGSEELSLSEPSTPSSDFWEATVEPIRSKVDAPDESHAINDQTSSSCFSSSVRSYAHVEVLGFGTKVMTDTLRPKSMARNPTHEATLSQKGNKDHLKSRGAISLNHQVPTHLNVKNTSPEWNSKMEAAKSFYTCLEQKDSDPKGHAPKKDVEEVCGLQHLAPKILQNKVDRTVANSDAVECRINHSVTLKDSKTGMPSSGCPRNHATLDVLSAKNGGNRGCDVHNAKSGISVPTRRVKDQFQASNSFRQSYLGSKIGLAGKYEGSFSYEHFVQLYNWNKIVLRPCGLVNCGNSCYANAVLQCLVFTPPLTAYFLQGLHSKTCGRREWCFICEFEFLVQKAKEGNSPLSPAPLLSQMERLGSHLGHGREEDAHEFLRYVIDAMQFVHLKEARSNKSNSLDEETTLVGLTFGGYLRSKIECMRCGGKSEQHERIMDLSVEIGGDIGTVEEALHQFTRSEILDGENKYHCGRCKSYEKAKKKLRVLEAPNVLTIALKRFQSGQYGKLNKVVKFPEVLNLAPYMSGTSDKSPIYRLYGVVVHLDSMNSTFSGHYVCYLKNNAGSWYKADDLTVQPVELGKVLLTAAYMLFYARCSPRSPKLRKSAPRETRKVQNPTCRCKFHQAEQWDVTTCKLNNHQTCEDCFYKHCSRHQLTRPNSEEDALSDNSSSIFSEAGSYSTESSIKESTCTDDSFDQMLQDLGNHLNKSWRSSSDSDTSSSSSSPSPLYTRHSPLSDLDRYSSDTETSGSNLVKSSSKSVVSTEKRRGSFSGPNPHTRLAGSSNSCCSRENDSNRVVGCDDCRDNMKNLHLRRSIR